MYPTTRQKLMKLKATENIKAGICYKDDSCKPISCSIKSSEVHQDKYHQYLDLLKDSK